jgi:hypothetical protein
LAKARRAVGEAGQRLCGQRQDIDRQGMTPDTYHHYTEDQRDEEEKQKSFMPSLVAIQRN